MAVRERGEQALRAMQQGTVFVKRQRCGGVLLTTVSSRPFKSCLVCSWRSCRNLTETAKPIQGVFFCALQDSVIPMCYLEWGRLKCVNSVGKCFFYIINCNNEEHQESFFIFILHLKNSVCRSLFRPHWVVECEKTSTYESSSRRSLLVLSWLFRRSKSARTWASSSSSLELRLEAGNDSARVRERENTMGKSLD